MPCDHRRARAGLEKDVCHRTKRCRNHLGGLDLQRDRVRIADLERLVCWLDGGIVKDEWHARDFRHVDPARFEPINEFPATSVCARGSRAVIGFYVKSAIEFRDLPQIDSLRRVVNGTVGHDNDRQRGRYCNQI